MSVQYNNAKLVESIKRRMLAPSSQRLYSDESYLEMATEVLQGEVVPLIMSTREEYFVEYVDIPCPESKRISFPENTTGMKLRSVCYIQNGNNPTSLVNLPRLDLDVVAGLGYSNWNTIVGFIVEGNELVLWTPSGVPAGTIIRIYLYRRTLALVEPNNYARIRSVNTGTNTVQLDNIPSAWASGTELNTVNSSVPFEIKNETLEIVSTSFPSLILNNVDDVSVGDYISDRGFSAIPQIPIEAHPYLAQMTAALALEGLGDPKAKGAYEKAERMKTSLLVLISRRVDGSVKKVMNPNGGLRVQSGVGRWGYGRGGFR